MIRTRSIPEGPYGGSMPEPRWATTSGTRGQPGVGFYVVPTLGAADPKSQREAARLSKPGNVSFSPKGRGFVGCGARAKAEPPPLQRYRPSVNGMSAGAGQTGVGAGSHGAPLLALLPARAVAFANKSSRGCWRRRSDGVAERELAARRLHPASQLGTNGRRGGCYAKHLVERPKRCGGAAYQLVKGPRLPAQSSRLSAQLPSYSLP